MEPASARLVVKSKAEAVYDLLRDRILSGEVAPGQPLSIDGLARELGVSKIPIREAIARLEAERLVEVVMHVGARVAPISVAEAENIYPIRHVLCDLGVHLAAGQIGDRTLDDLERLQDEMEAATRARDTRRIDPLNREFHLAIVRASGNPQLYELYRDLMHRCSRFRANVVLSQQRAVEVMREHRAILDALWRRDVEAAVRASREHDEVAARDIVARLREQEAAKHAV
ncbi:MAG: GntR family transcriptional regulator [Chloroflexi bacterium]|nr:GntR family transcriptional regulator [Chloroflexota bacterium]